MICEKCNGTKFSEWTASGARFRRCVTCNNTQILKSTPEWEEYCQNLVNEKASKNQPPTITCPYCQSTDTKKISVISRSMSFGFFGFGSSKVGKQWHCGKCGSDF